MAHFARVQNGIVTQVVVIEQEMIDTGLWGPPDEWVQTSYNTHGGQHMLGGTPLRKNYAGIGHTYDPVLDAFIPPKVFDSWILDETTGHWAPPTPHPSDGKKYMWEEATTSWIESNIGPFPEGEE